jgi:sugar phosphate isomerase/epimerase
MTISRRHFLGAPAALAAAAAPRTKMTIHLSAGSIGVKANTRTAIAYAAQHGFESIDADPGFLGGLSAAELEGLLGEMKAKGIVWAISGLRTEFRRDEETFQTTLKALPEQAAALKRGGVSRVTTWVSPASDTLSYIENFRQHARRLREVATILGDHGCRFGLEYVGPKTSWASRRYPFVHTMKEMRDLIAEIDRPNMGLVMDSWHWYTARDTVADLAALTNHDVVAIDLNDAPAGLAVDQQIDSARELPMATGVIDMKGFLNTLNKIGCDAPARAEPFNAALRKLPPEEALAATATAMKKAFALIE